jgi:SLIT-ROBO Rho GTPase activating protein
MKKRGEWIPRVSEIRSQLSDQLRCLEQRTETQVSLLNEVHEYFRRRAEIDAEHARQLDKLAKSIMQKHKNEKNR